MASGSLPSAGPGSPPRSGFLRRGLAIEFGLFRQPKVALAALAIICVPSLYVLIYVSSVWDSYGQVRQLPAALVNEDIPAARAGREVKLGADVVAALERDKPFAFVRYPSVDAARRALRDGEVFFALLIPPDFSRHVVGGTEPATLTVVVSEGANFTASIFSRRFGGELAHTLNEKVARERWALLVGPADGGAGNATLRDGLIALQSGGHQVAAGASGMHTGSGRLREGLARASEGAKALAAGADALTDGATRLTDGMKQVETTVATIRTALPDDGKLRELADGSRALTAGALQLKQGLEQLQAGMPRLEAGTDELKAGAAKVPLVGGKLAAGTGRLRDGIALFGDGLNRAAIGAARLEDGLDRLDPGVEALSSGVVRLNAGLATFAEKLPPPERLDFFDESMGRLREGAGTLAGGLTKLEVGAARLEGGSAELAGGAQRLADGLDTAINRFDAGFGGLGAGRLAAPVEVVVDADTAPVANNGRAFAPYFSALSIWVGALMMSFVFYLRRLPESLQPAARPVKWLAKVAPLLGLGLLQASVVVGVLRFVLGVPFAHPGSVWLAAVLGSVAFVCILLCLMSLLGDAGRLLAVVLLILQLAASGGIYPVELSAPFYQHVHGWLPFTFLVRAFRATMFDAFDGRWGYAAGALAGFAAGATLLSLLLARWRYIADKNYGPAVEF
jgi:putative membrane protein